MMFVTTIVEIMLTTMNNIINFNRDGGNKTNKMIINKIEKKENKRVSFSVTKSAGVALCTRALQPSYLWVYLKFPGFIEQLMRFLE